MRKEFYNVSLMYKDNTGSGNTKMGWKNWTLLDIMTDNSFHVRFIGYRAYLPLKRFIF